MINNINTGGPAFPSEFWNEKVGLEVNHSGMMLRDYFAAQALLIMPHIASVVYTNPKSWLAEHYASAAYEIADAMLNQREKSTPTTTTN